jgi:hypothetical protein
VKGIFIGYFKLRSKYLRRQGHRVGEGLMVNAWAECGMMEWRRGKSDVNHDSVGVVGPRTDYPD